MAAKTIVDFANLIKDYTNNVYKVMGEMGAKNLLNLRATNVNASGLTETKNYDDKGNIVSIKLNGSTGTNFNFYAMSARAKADAIRLKANTEYIVSIGNSNPNVRISVGYTNPNGGAYVDVGSSEYGVSEFEFVSPVDDTPWTIQLEAPNNTTLSDFIIYPMVRLASDTDSTYTSYAKTNKELTELISNQGLDILKIKKVELVRNSYLLVTAPLHIPFFVFGQRSLSFMFNNWGTGVDFAKISDASSSWGNMPSVTFESSGVTKITNNINSELVLVFMSYDDFTIS